jgi:uncharacterized RDD family membrane protein YckC
VYAGSSAAAPALHYDAHEASPVSRTAVADAPVARKAINYQQSLFSSRELPRVVPFETIAPGAIEVPKRRSASTPARQRPRKVIAGQQSLEFAPSVRSSRPQEGAIYCDAPVAISTHRSLAGVLDAAIVAAALVVLGVVLRIAGCEVVLNVRTIPLYLTAAAGIMIFYRLLWCLANGDSPGMRWANLTLINFDGQRPTRRQRIVRTASGFLSLAAAGLGLVWAFVDEETLTWHDHISKTFPTPR